MSGELQFAYYPFEGEDPPESWKITALNNVLENIRPGFASGQHNKDGEGIPHLRPMNISPSGSIDLSEVLYVQGDNPLRLRRDDVLFNNTNSPAWVGKTALVETDDELTFSNHMTRLRISSAVDPMFIAKQLHFLCSQGYFRHHCKKHVNQASIAAEFLRRYVPVRLPPAAEQRRIVAKIEALQERSRRAREALAEVQPLIDEFRQSVLAAAFRGDLTADWRAAHPDVEPASELLHRIRAERRRRWEQAELAKYDAQGQNPSKNWGGRYEEPEAVDNSDLPELPVGWAWCQLGLLGADPLNTVQTGPFGAQLHRTEFTTEGVPVIAVGNLTGIGFTKKGLYFITEKKAGQLHRYDVQAGDLLFARSGATLGKVCIAPSYVNDWRMTGHILRARLNRAFVLPEIVAFALWGEPAVKSNVTRRIRGMTRPGYNTSLLQSVPIPLPPLEEQRELVALVSQVLSGVDNIASFIQASLTPALDQLDQAIIAKAFRGELVPQDPSDEPAAVLLERIRAQRKQQAEAPKKTPETQRRSTMGKRSPDLMSQHRPLVEILTTKGQPMPPELLLTDAGYDDGSIEDFYLALREEIKKGHIREGRPSEGEVMLEAI
jgi:type I restriction enzyme S subunit